MGFFASFTQKHINRFFFTSVCYNTFSGEKKPMKTADIRKHLNFRELGGYQSADGRKVVHGQFFRSGPLADLNDEEMAYVKSLGIRHVFDFRSEYEANEVPDPDIGAEHHLINAMVDGSGNQVQFDPKSIEEAAKDHEQANGFIEQMYGNLPFCQAYKEMFEVIKAEQTPILFHCSAGKDRTGIAAVLILLLLGVDEKTALDDYELTNEYRKELIEKFFARVAHIIGDDMELKQKMQAFEGVNRSSAEYSLKTIKSRYADYGAYFEDVFGIDKEMRKKLQDKYLI
jgi:protein-tyrosine phosphatase